MNEQQKIEKLKNISNEAEFRLLLIDLLKRMGYKDVVHTHRFGSPELGKDIIARLVHPIDGDEWYAFVVKHGRISGGSVEIETIKAQVKQAFEYHYNDLQGNRIRVNKVKVVTNVNFTTGAQTSISNSSEMRAFSNVDYWWYEKLIPLIDEKYPDLWLPGDEFCKEYTTSIKRIIQEEFELKDFSIKIEDKKIKKLLDLFIEPVITETVVEEKKDGTAKLEKQVSRKKVTLNSLGNNNDNILITGEPGSGKTKLLNNIALLILNTETNPQEKIIPVKLKGKELKDHAFHVEGAVANAIKLNSPETFSRTNLSEYKKVLFIDEIDILTKDEKDLLFEQINNYCVNGNKFYLTQRKNDNLDLSPEGGNTRTLRISNFNLKQVESFIQKYFEGSDRGEKFIQILRESNLFAKLPTTPLTITLISLLYDENGYEIPATLADIYEDFIQVLFGKLEVRNRKELLLFNIKKRIFTSYALKRLDE